MKKVLFSILMFLSLVCVPATTYARNSDDAKVVKEISDGLPVYMGGGITWRTFDINDKGDIEVGLLSNNLPDASEVTEEQKEIYKNALTGPNSGYANLSKKLGRNLIVNIYNTANQLCITAKIPKD